jgi:hypothetical protein
MNNGQLFYAAVKGALLHYRMHKIDANAFASAVEGNIMAFDLNENEASESTNCGKTMCHSANCEDCYPKPAVVTDWDLFLAEATDVFVAKNTDYDSRFMKALVQYQAERGPEAARTIWAWEVEKKLDRCRTWIKRGELLVQDEGVKNSVQDLFIYTVQFVIFNGEVIAGRDPFALLNDRDFYAAASKFYATDWVEFLVTEKLITPDEYDLRQELLVEMTGITF